MPTSIKSIEDNQKYTEKVNDKDNKKRPRQRLQNRNMTFQEKLFLI